MTEPPDQQPEIDRTGPTQGLPAAPPLPDSWDEPAQASEPGVEGNGASEAAAFSRTLAELTPHLFITPAIIAINVAVFAVMVVMGVDPIQPKVDDLIRWGADFGPKTTHGEQWRLLTCNYLHI